MPAADIFRWYRDDKTPSKKVAFVRELWPGHIFARSPLGSRPASQSAGQLPLAFLIRWKNLQWPVSGPAEKCTSSLSFWLLQSQACGFSVRGIFIAFVIFDGHIFSSYLVRPRGNNFWQCNFCLFFLCLSLSLFIALLRLTSCGNGSFHLWWKGDVRKC